MCLPQILAPVRLEDLMPIGAIDELEPSSSTLYMQTALHGNLSLQGLGIAGRGGCLGWD